MSSRVMWKGGDLKDNEFNEYVLVGVPVWCAAEIGNARFGVASWHVGRELAVQELVVNGSVIWDSGVRLWVHGKDHEIVDQIKRPIKGEVGLENDGISVFPVD